MDCELSLDESVIGRASDCDRDPGDDPPDDADLGRAAIGEGRQAMPIGLRRPLTRDLEGDERVIGLHVNRAPA
jgi:hypothetical protein